MAQNIRAGATAPGQVPQNSRPNGLLARFRTTLEMIKFEHSIFALAFALTGALLAARGWPALRQTAPGEDENLCAVIRD